MEKVIYWEKQDPKTKMCALHCLNSLLQGPLVTADELSEISLMLDSEESRLLNGNFGYNGTVLGYGNVSDSGDFNLPVLQSALAIRNISYSLREGPTPVEPGSLYDYVKKNLETGNGVVLLVVPTGTKLPDPNPVVHPVVQPNQFYVKLSDVEGGNEGGRFGNSGVVQSAADSNKGDADKVWPTSGGVRLDEEVDQPVYEDEYSGTDSVKIAIKLFNSRITKSFSPNSPIKSVFDWIETKEDLKERDFYYLLQTVPYRKFIKYSNGSIEMVNSDSGPLEVTDQPLNKLDFGSNDMFMLRLD